jgi:TRAP-type mannitol/chloroaromatic compound transport system permease small subunit
VDVGGMQRLLTASNAIERVVGAIATASGWLFLVCTFVIVFDVVSRKFGYQLPNFGSTRLQELEWHLHTAIFSFWLGFAYIRNAHVRIDVVTSHLRPSTNLAIELLGCIAFALPYCLIALYFSIEYAWIAWLDNEASVSASGLPYRYIPKALIAAGLLLLLLAVVSVMLRTIVALRAPAGHLNETAAR